MVNDAEVHAAEDKVRRQEVEIRNAADSTVYQVKRQMSEMGGKLPAHEKSRLELLLAETEQALKDHAPIDRIRTLTSDLTQAANAFATGAGPGSPSSGGSSAPGADGSDDVIDAEFTEK